MWPFSFLWIEMHAYYPLLVLYAYIYVVEPDHVAVAHSAVWRFKTYTRVDAQQTRVKLITGTDIGPVGGSTGEAVQLRPIRTAIVGNLHRNIITAAVQIFPSVFKAQRGTTCSAQVSLAPDSLAVISHHFSRADPYYGAGAMAMVTVMYCSLAVSRKLAVPLSPVAA